MNGNAFLAASPLLVVALGGLLLMVSEAFSKHRREEAELRSSGPSSDLALGTAITLIAGAIFSAGVFFVGPAGLDAASLAPWLILDRFSLFFMFVLCVGGALSALLAGGYLPEHKIDRGEFYPLIIFSTLGAMMLAAAGDLLSLFIGLETMSLGVYALAGFRRASARSTEAALKYFLLGSFAAALLLYGGALIYGATGHTDLEGIRAAIASPPAAGKAANPAVLLIGAALVIVGLAFKVSAVPFHMWTPDAYEGAPTPATTFMAVAVKSAAFATLVRVLLDAFGHPTLASWASGWPPIVALLALLTMTVANLIAGRQESVKRMLAYSSIAHAGYVLVGVVSTMKLSGDAQTSVMFYLLAYTASTAGAFGALILCGSRGAEAVSYDDLAGLGRRHPAAALAFSFFLLSLAGVPPTAGFFGKFYVVKAAMGAGFYTLAVVLVLNSVLSAYYYLRVLVFMYMRDPAPGAPLAKPMRSAYVTAALVLAGLMVLVLGIWPSTYIEIAAQAVLASR